jgi:hypothetical protein
MGVPPEEQRPGSALRGTVFDDRLRGGQDVRLVERTVQAGSPMPGGAERHLLGDVLGVGRHAVVGGHQVRQVDQVFRLRRLPGARMGGHASNCALRIRRDGGSGTRLVAMTSECGVTSR